MHVDADKLLGQVTAGSKTRRLRIEAMHITTETGMSGGSDRSRKRPATEFQSSLPFRRGRGGFALVLGF